MNVIDLTKTEKRIYSLYVKHPILVGDDDWLYAMIIQEDGFKELEDIVHKRVTRFKTVDRAARSVRHKLGITSNVRKERALQVKRHFAGQ